METLLFISSWARIYRRNVRKDVRLLHDSREVQGKLCSAVLKALEIFLFAVPARGNLSVWEFHRMPCAAGGFMEDADGAPWKHDVPPV